MSAVFLQAVGSVVLLVGFIIATAYFQQRSLTLRGDLLETAPDSVKGTTLFVSAFEYFDRRRTGSILTDARYIVPVWFLILVVFFCSCIAYFGAHLFVQDNRFSYILGGAYAIKSASDPTYLESYQSGTVFTGSIAFLSAYIWTITSLVVRINNNDMNPMSYYFFATRIVVACLVAAIARHMAEAIPGLHTIISYESDPKGFPVGLAILGFVVGWNPSLWLDDLWRQGMKVFGLETRQQRQAEQECLPQDLQLSMLQGMTDEKIERLREIDIDNCQKMAYENPVITWVRTTYNLELITDWAAQAQLILLFEACNVAALRKMGIRDIFDYFSAASNPTTRTVLATTLSISVEIIENHAVTIPSDPAYQRLLQLRDVLRP